MIFKRLYHMILSDNCNCLDSVAVRSVPDSAPAAPAHPLGPLLPPGPTTHAPLGPGVAVPPGASVVGSKRNSFWTGGLKFTRFVRLNTSNLNLTLKVSEIRVTFVFFSTEKSKDSSPGPVMILRPEFPRGI